MERPTGRMKFNDGVGKVRCGGGSGGGVGGGGGGVGEVTSKLGKQVGY